ncbi:hypothetical protein BC351_02285 [Paenibacillus ferrarius]|uniref:Uncharacterized protein n=1 Tax=Paenibacillus ferrarius TaxID=1469647 RepID=A0A1V4HT71_9BACL|nr:hypothetical protein [Paenibacillus ferrarius]OPH62087.1 hypothetical protein BC351_02285 [Paenibacillus ferrarius]
MKTTCTITIIIAFVILLGANLSDLVPGKSQTFVIFGQNMNAELHEALVSRLEKNKIDYQIDKQGNVTIAEKDVQRAVICCS